MPSDKSARQLTRFVKYPRYIRVQRMKSLLQSRMKVPPVVAMFRTEVSRNLHNEIMGLAEKHKTETPDERRHRLEDNAKNKKDTKAPPCLVTGVSAVTRAVENAGSGKGHEAKLVLIADDVDPLEIVMFLPTLCHTKNVPFAIVRSKAELGKLCHVKTCSCVAFTTVKDGCQAQLEQVINKVKQEVNYKQLLERKQGGHKKAKKQDEAHAK